MTTVAYKNGQMAADRQITYQGSIKVNSGRAKIARDSNGVLYGVCGSHASCCAVIDAVNKQAQTGGAVTLPIPQKGDEFEILIAYPDGRLRRMTPVGEEIYDDQPYFATGAGLEVAIGAMYAGASAHLAIAAAVQHSVGTDGEIDVLYHPSPQMQQRHHILVDKMEDADPVSINTQKIVEDIYREMADAPVKHDVTETGNRRASLSPEEEFDRIANTKDI